MKVIKVAAGFACGLIILLFTLIVFIENPEKERYEKVVESIMIHQGLSSLQEVLDAFPELKVIRSKMNRIAYLKSHIYEITGAPAPNISREESLQIQDYNHEIYQLQRSVHEKLTQLLVTLEEGKP